MDGGTGLIVSARSLIFYGKKLTEKDFLDSLKRKFKIPREPTVNGVLGIRSGQPEASNGRLNLLLWERDLRDLSFYKRSNCCCDKPSHNENLQDSLMNKRASSSSDNIPSNNIQTTHESVVEGLWSFPNRRSNRSRIRIRNNSHRTYQAIQATIPHRSYHHTISSDGDDDVEL